MVTLNLGNSIFEGFNDKRGVMLCGYEWGFSQADQEALGDQAHQTNGVQHSFSSKWLEYGIEKVRAWRYDQRMIKWFGIWGHPLQTDGTWPDFDKCLMQTNWCDSEAHHIEGDYRTKLLAADQIDNFMGHIQSLQPSVILFLGTQLLPILQTPEVLTRFQAIVGPAEAPPRYETKPFDGKCFKVGFQKFRDTSVVCLPHPSGSHGLSDDYIALFTPEIGAMLAEFKASRSI